MKTTLFSFLALAIIILACKKESTTPSRTPVEYLKAHKWGVLSMTIDPANDWYQNGTKITDILAPLDACEKDNILGFSSDTTCFFLGGAVKCKTNEKDTLKTEKYSISADSKYFEREGYNTSALIKEISDNKFVLETTFIDKNDNLQYVVTEIYQAK